jgi:hypothetical protein
MACPNFEDLLNGQCGDHVLNCKDCRALLEACAEVDSVFDAAFSGISAPSGVTAAMRMRINEASMRRRLSLFPEFLDLIGWAAVLAAAAILLPRFTLFLRSLIAGLG